MNRTPLTRCLLFALTVGLLGVFAQPASAQVFVGPIVGYNFGGDAGCPDITNCKNKNLNIGAAFGDYGDLFGIEEEFSYAKDFFGDVPSYNASVVTLMTNFLVVPAIGPVKPYFLVGGGLMKSNVEFGSLNALKTATSTVAWDIGGGVVARFGGNFGVRGDVRFFKAVKDFDIGGLNVEGSKLNFGRIGAGFLFFF